MDINDIKPKEVGDRFRNEELNAIVDQIKKNVVDIDRIEITGPSSMGGVVPNTSFVPEMGSVENPSIWFATGGTPEAPVILPNFGNASLTSPLNVISWDSVSAVVKGVPVVVPEPDLSGLVAKEDLIEAYPINWEQGSIETTSGANYPEGSANYTTRIRTAGLIQSKGRISVTTKQGQQVAVYYYTNEGLYVSQTGFLTTPIDIVFEGKFRLVVRKQDSSASLTPSENTAVVFNGSIYITKEEYKSRLDPLEKLFTGVESVSFERGTIQASNGNTAGSTSRLRSMLFTEGEVISAVTDDTQQVAIFVYDEDESFIRYIDFAQKHEDVDISGKYKIVIKNVDNSAILPKDNTVFIYKERVFATKSELADLEGKLFEVKELVLNVEQGVFSAQNGIDANSERFVRTGFHKALEIKELTVPPTTRASIVFFDENKIGIGQTPYRSTHSNVTVPLNSMYRVAVENIEGGLPLTPEEVQLSVTITDYRFNTSNGHNGDNDDGDDGEPALFSKFKPPTLSSAPYGDTINYTFTQKEALFEEILDGYPAEWTKEKIGESYNGEYDVNAYVLTPEKFTVTVAITSHVHGNEKYNPTGFFALLNLISDRDLKHDFLKWIRENVRWIIVPFVSPMGYVLNTRTTDSVNLNRNMDYEWADIAETQHKGSAPMSSIENQNIANFFMPIKDEIDFHLDTHDIPASPDISYWLWQNSSFVWLKEQDYVENYLGVLNETRKQNSRYVAVGGSYTQYFTEILGIPSITPEHSTQWWIDYPADVQIAKSAEQISALLCMFANLHVQYRGQPFYKKLVERSFCSERFGIFTWDYPKFHSYLSDLPEWTETEEAPGVISYTLQPIAYTKTILVLAGASADNKNSSFVVKHLMEELLREDEKLPMYVRHLKQSRVIVIPTVNGVSGFVPEENLQSTVEELVTKYNPNYTLLVRGVENSTESAPLRVRTNNESSVTRWTREHIKDISIGVEGIEAFIPGRYSVAILNNHIENTFKYAHGVVKWIELVVNDLASFNKE